MKVLFAVSSESISEQIIKRYRREYKEILTYKNVYYFNAILKEIQKDKTYDRIVISEDLEPFANNNYNTIDKTIFEKLDAISDEAQDSDGKETSIILICSDRRTKNSPLLVKLFSIGIYNALIENDRNIEQVCNLIKRPRSKKEAKIYYKVDSDDVTYRSESENEVSEIEIQNILNYFKRNSKNPEKFSDGFNSIAAQYTDAQLRIIINCLPIKVKSVLEKESYKYREIMKNKLIYSNMGGQEKESDQKQESGIKVNSIGIKNREKLSKPIVIPSAIKKSEKRKVVVTTNKGENKNVIVAKHKQEPQVSAESKKPEVTHNIVQKEKPAIENKAIVPNKTVLNENAEKEEYKVPSPQEMIQKQEPIKEVEMKEPIIDEDVDFQTQEIEEVAEQKRGRGRPRKYPVSMEVKPKGKRGRPRKVVEEPEEIDNEDEEIKLPSFDNEKADDLELPSFDDMEEEIELPSSDNEEDEDIELPSFDDDEEEGDEVELPSFDDDEEEGDEVELPSFDDDEEEGDEVELPSFDDDEEEDIELPSSDDEEDEEVELPSFDDDEEEGDEAELPSFDDDEEEDIELPSSDDEEDEDVELPSFDDDEEEDVELPSFKDDEEDVELPSSDEEEEEDVELPSSDDEEDEEVELPSFDDDEEEDIELPSSDDEEDEDVELPSFDDDEEEDIELPSSDDEEDEENIIISDNYGKSENSSNEVPSIKSNIDYSMSSLNSLMTKDKKIVTFLGTSKNGTSFIVNNLAVLFDSMGINTAILDMTNNKNSYYIYTNNDESLRKVAYKSITNLKNGYAEGIKVGKNLTVYTALPSDGNDYSDAESILSTLVQNHSLVLIDCDFTTPPGYFASCQEIYLVQSMDILTIQPLTMFLRDLKTKGALDSEKVRVVINKELRMKALTSKMVIAGMSFYNDPAMSFMTDLFNKDLVKACTIPFDESVYSKYLDGMVDCKVSINGYSNNFISKLKILSEMVYPRLPGATTSFEKPKKGFGLKSDKFTDDMNNTLEQMRKKY